ncbi:MAG: undecaprenyl-diphosphate phosphatase, partial [Sphingomonadales bacterium]
PVVTAGLVVASLGWQEHLRSATVIGWTTLLFGLILYVVDQKAAMVRKLEDMTWGPALIIGLAQMLALVPGTSRSGVTMTAARMLGLSRSDAAHFSMLLSIPTILAAGSLAGLEIHQAGDAILGYDALAAAGLAFITALGAITFLMRWLERSSFTPFVIYRVVLGLALLGWAYA